MADAKKPDDKKPPTNLGTELIFLFAGLIILSVILNQILLYFNSIGLGNESAWSNLVNVYLGPFWRFLKIFAVISGAASVVWIAFNLKKLHELDEADEKVYGLEAVEPVFKQVPEKAVEAVGKKKENERWKKIKELSLSESSSDWRLAIIEADVMLEELLRSLALHGDTVGDMLKSAEGTIINTDAAWEAHKVRNRIAHSGTGFELTDRSARHTIALFETVFKEAGVI
jgi:hypothetical protein